MDSTKIILSFSFIFILFSCSNSNPTGNELQDKNVTEDSLVSATPEIDEFSDVDDLTTEPIQEEEYKSTDLMDIGWELMGRETFGGVKMGLDTTAVIELIGLPDTISPEVFWGADAGFHSDWVYNELGISLGMVRSEENAGPGYMAKQVDRMTLNSQSTFCTSRNICIGASIAEVKESYRKAISDDFSQNDCLIAGTVYGGLIFSFEGGKVVEIFLGARAE